MTVDQHSYRHRALPASQRGLSLVELMIAVGLGVFLTWGAVEAFLSGKQTYSMQQAVSRIQENGRLAQEFLAFDIRNAGSYGCVSDQYVANLDNVMANVSGSPSTLADEFKFQNAVFAVNNVTGAPNGDMNLQTLLSPPPVAGTDILVVRTGTDVGIAGVNAGGYRAVAVCNTGSLTIYDPTDVVAPVPIAPPVGPPVSVMRLETAIYYIANNAAGNPSLYRRMLADGATSQELLDGVENMQVELGLDLGSTALAYDFPITIDSYVTPNAVTAAQWNSWSDTVVPAKVNAWYEKPAVGPEVTNSPPKKNIEGIIGDAAEERVRAVRYSLLLRSQENLLETPQTYTYNGVAVVAPDNRLRQVSGGTVGIRNRLSLN